MTGFPLTLTIAAVFGLAVGLASYFAYFRKTNIPNPIRWASFLGGIAFVATIIIGLITE